MLPSARQTCARPRTRGCHRGLAQSSFWAGRAPRRRSTP